MRTRAVDPGQQQYLSQPTDFQWENFCATSILATITSRYQQSLKGQPSQMWLCE